MFYLCLVSSDERLCSCVSHFNDNVKLFSDCRIPNFFPFEKFLIRDVFDTKFLRINMADIHRKLIGMETDQHENNGGSRSMSDFLSVYMSTIKELQQCVNGRSIHVGKKSMSVSEKETTINSKHISLDIYIYINIYALEYRYFYIRIIKRDVIVDIHSFSHLTFVLGSLRRLNLKNLICTG